MALESARPTPIRIAGPTRALSLPAIGATNMTAIVKGSVRRPAPIAS